MKRNKIYIIGAGAIGKALAAFLKNDGKDVTLIRGSVDDKTNYLESIEVELSNGNIISCEVPVSTLSNYSILDGIVVLTTKSFGNQQLAQSLKERMNDSPLVILQNGLNVEQPFIDAGYSQIYRCVLFTSSQKTGINRLRFKPADVSRIGLINGTDSNLRSITNELNSKYFEFKAEPNIQPLIWTKAIANCVFNSICPLLEIDNGVFYREEKALAIARRIIAECISIARLRSVHLDNAEVLNTVLRISRSSDSQFISTYVDIKNKRKTEIETFNLAMANIGRELGKEDLVKETRLLGELTQIKAEIAMTK